MTDNEKHHHLIIWLDLLQTLLPEYKGRTIDNIIDNIKQRINYYESKPKPTKDH